MEQRINWPLPLEGSSNTRDLGGYRTEDGRMTRYHRLLRSDGLHGLTSGDGQILLSYGVVSSIDLRSPIEAERRPDVLPKSIRQVNFPLLDQVRSQQCRGLLPESMEAVYASLFADSGDLIAGVLREIIKHPRQCVLFHCTAGKDRTGIISMLMLKLAGVADETIVEDYAVTERNMEQVFRRQRQELEQAGIPVKDLIFDSKPACMEHTLRQFEETYQTVPRYLERIGLTPDEIQALRAHLLEK